MVKICIVDGNSCGCGQNLKIELAHGKLLTEILGT